MRIENDIKLDFKDVLIRPKRSVLKSRSEVSLEREFKFKHSDKVWHGIPIIAANMDHTGTLNMARALAEHGLMTALDKFLPVPNLKKFAEENKALLSSTFFSLGTSDADFDRLRELSAFVEIPYICLDVANGYTERFVSFLERLREAYSNAVIMAGNVVTGEMVE